MPKLGPFLVTCLVGALYLSVVSCMYLSVSLGLFMLGKTYSSIFALMFIIWGVLTWMFVELQETEYSPMHHLELLYARIANRK